MVGKAAINETYRPLYQRLREERAAEVRARGARVSAVGQAIATGANARARQPHAAPRDRDGATQARAGGGAQELRADAGAKRVGIVGGQGRRLGRVGGVPSSSRQLCRAGPRFPDRCTALRAYCCSLHCWASRPPRSPSGCAQRSTTRAACGCSASARSWGRCQSRTRPSSAPGKACRCGLRAGLRRCARRAGLMAGANGRVRSRSARSPLPEAGNAHEADPTSGATTRTTERSGPDAPALRCTWGSGPDTAEATRTNTQHGGARPGAAAGRGCARCAEHAIDPGRAIPPHEAPCWPTFGCRRRRLSGGL